MSSAPSWAELSEQWEEVLSMEKKVRVEVMQEQRCSFFSIKLKVPLAKNTKSLDLQEAEHSAMKARHVAFEACLEAKQAADCNLQLQIGLAAAALVEEAIAEAFQVVRAEAVQRELWQLKEVEDQERQELLHEEEAMRNRSGLAGGHTIARRMLQLTRTELSRKFAQRALQVEKKECLSADAAIQLWDLNAEEATARHQIVAEERLAMARVRHLELKALKPHSNIAPPVAQQSPPKVDSVAFISDMVGAMEVFLAQQQQRFHWLANRLRAEEATKRQLMMQSFGAARSSLLKEMRNAEARLWDAWAAQQVANAQREEALNRTANQMVHTALQQAMSEISAEVKAHNMSPAKRGTSLRLRPEEVREVAEQHAIVVSPVKAANPVPPARAARPEEAKPERTGRRIFIRRQGERLKKQQEEVAGGMWSAKNSSLLRKQQAVGRTMVNPKALTLPPIVSPFNVRAPMLT
eukprot:GGOE01045634.1.p1 GENE.GGOE01045634.1~~GGOE01045634.1.p1  ORF type:complete len:485 (+),score=127.48 GGOE01045634.1:63-1457(+)